MSLTDDCMGSTSMVRGSFSQLIYRPNKKSSAGSIAILVRNDSRELMLTYEFFSIDL